MAQDSLVAKLQLSAFDGASEECAALACRDFCLWQACIQLLNEKVIGSFLSPLPFKTLPLGSLPRNSEAATLRQAGDAA